MKTFDFGAGHVPAHQHSNGMGWVADTAHVDATAYVGPDAQVGGKARVYGNAQVYGNARVGGDARVYGNAQVCCLSDYLVLSPIGSRGDSLTITFSPQLQLHTGCRTCGIEEFEAAVHLDHKGDKYEAEYMLALEFIRRIVQARGKEG